MARGKKLFLQIAALAMSATMAFGFAACGDGEQKEHQHADADGDGYCDTDGTWIGEGEDPALHEHTYDTTKWAYDDTYHYHAGNCGHDVLKDRERHSFEGDAAKCIVCDYERSFDDIYQMYLGGAIYSLQQAKYNIAQAFSIKNWSEYAKGGYKLDYDETTQTWKTKTSIDLVFADQVVVINTISHTQYGVNNTSSQYGAKVDKEGKYFVSLKLGELTPVLTRDYGEHTHTYTEWGYDADNHWKQCADDGEKDPSTVAPHTFGDDGHCTQEGCSAVSQEKCKHEKGFAYNYTKTTMPSSKQAQSGQLMKVCPDCGKEQPVPVARGVASTITAPVPITPIEGTYYGQSFVQGYFAFREPGTYTLQVLEPVWDDDSTLTLTSVAVCVNGSQAAKAGGWEPLDGLGCNEYGSPNVRTYARTAVYDYAKENGWETGANLSSWQSKIKINGKPASEWTDKWAAFTSITVTVTQEDIDAVPDQVIKATQEGKEDTPVPKYVYVSFCALGKKDQEINFNKFTYGAWLYTVTEDSGTTEDCKHEHLTYAKADADEANRVTAGETGTLNATCTDCNEQISVPFTKPKQAPSSMSVRTYDVGTKYYISAAGYVAFELKEAGTYTLTRTAVYNVPDVADDEKTEDEDETQTYCYFFNGVYISAKAGKAAADAVYLSGEWKQEKSAWFSKIKFDGNVGGQGYETKQDTFTFTITVTEGDLASGSLFVTIGVWYGAEESSGWTSTKAGHYEFLEMTKESDAVSEVAVAKEYCIPTRKGD